MERGSCRTERPVPMISGGFHVFAVAWLDVLADERGVFLVCADPQADESASEILEKAQPPQVVSVPPDSAPLLPFCRAGVTAGNWRRAEHAGSLGRWRIGA